MLFPEEIFKMILKQHKINYLEMKLNFDHRIRTNDSQNIVPSLSTFTFKKLMIQFHQSDRERLNQRPFQINYFWENRWDLQTPKLLMSLF